MGPDWQHGLAGRGAAACRACLPGRLPACLWTPACCCLSDLALPLRLVLLAPHCNPFQQRPPASLLSASPAHLPLLLGILPGGNAARPLLADIISSPGPNSPIPQGGSAARPMRADIIHDGSKQARVRVEGQVNGQPFVVERTAKAKAKAKKT